MPAGGGGAATAGGLEPGLARQRARIQRSRLGGAAAAPRDRWRWRWRSCSRRWRCSGCVPQLVVVVVPLVLLAATLGWALRRRLSLAAVAQLLDERLRLFDRLGTALELERRGAGNGGGTALERRDGGRSGGPGRGRRRPVAAAGGGGAARVGRGGPWRSLVLAALVVSRSCRARAPARVASGGRPRRSAQGAPGAGRRLNKKALEQYLGAKSRPGGHPTGPGRAGRQIRPAAPRGGKAAGKRYTGEAYVTPSEGQPTQAQQGFHFKDESLDEGPVGVHAGGESKAGGGESKTGGRAGRESGRRQSGRRRRERAGRRRRRQAGSGAGCVAGDPGRPARRRRQPGHPDPRQRRRPRKPPPGRRSGSSQGSPETGSPGGNTAGNGAGGNRTGRSREIEGGRVERVETAGRLRARTARPRAAPARARAANDRAAAARPAPARWKAARRGQRHLRLRPRHRRRRWPTGGSQGLAQSYSAALGWLERLPW